MGSDTIEGTSNRSIYIFGRDITEIPCFRKSLIVGICTGVAGGLACFLGTSKPLFSTHIGFASIWIGVFCYWFPCRYHYESRQLAMHLIRDKKRKMEAEANENESESTVLSKNQEGTP